MICSHCGELTSPQAKKCVHCGLVTQKHQMRRKNQLLQCPSCQVELNLIRMAGIDLDLCQVCTGVWFDKGEITEFVQKASENQRSQSFQELFRQIKNKSGKPRNRRFVDCPVCHAMMLQKPLQGTPLRLDFCKHHGIWADYQQCMALLRVVGNGLTNMKSRRSQNLRM